MPVGPILVTILAVLVWSGFFTQTLAQLRLSRRTSLMLLLAILFGSGVEIPLPGGFSGNLGSLILPLALALYFAVTGKEQDSPFWMLSGALVTGIVVYFMGRWFPPGQPTELNLFFLDAQYLFGLIAGLAGFITGRSVRGSFAAASLGVIVADLLHIFIRIESGEPAGAIRIGGGGFQETAVVAGVLAIALARFLGENRAPSTLEQ